jgi:hypothetical protein
MRELLNKLDDIAVFTTGPTTVTLPPRIDVERGAAVLVKGTDAFESGAGWAQRDVTAHDVHDVVGLFHPLCQGYPIIRQGTPGGSNTRNKESEELSVGAAALSTQAGVQANLHPGAIASICRKESQKIVPIHGQREEDALASCLFGKVLPSFPLRHH